MSVPSASSPRIERVRVSAHTVPTDSPESDGTYAWDSTTVVVVEADSDGRTGVGYTYTDATAAGLIEQRLADVVEGGDALAVRRARTAMLRAVRNIGRPGLVSNAISAVDAALWDLEARLLDLPLATLLGRVHDDVAVYGSGGFTSYDIGRLRDQMDGWTAEGIRRVKMKVGREPARDRERVAAVRETVGPDVDLFVDANGAYGRKQALAFAVEFAELDVSWFEEPVASDDLDGLRLLRDRAPAGMEIAAGEYAWDLGGFRRLLDAGAVDVLQADATRCGGITGFLDAATLCDAAGVPLSAHTAPALHLHPCSAAERVRHIEYFHDHAQIERHYFDGAPRPVDGRLRPDTSRPGNGLTFLRDAAERDRVEPW
ncbi:MAG: enolase C-terminal domain-like protein [Gemmatimonadota bacterium]